MPVQGTVPTGLSRLPPLSPHHKLSPKHSPRALWSVAPHSQCHTNGRRPNCMLLTTPPLFSHATATFPMALQVRQHSQAQHARHHPNSYDTSWKCHLHVGSALVAVHHGYVRGVCPYTPPPNPHTETVFSCQKLPMPLPALRQHSPAQCRLPGPTSPPSLRRL
jgi:hypothetical protein